MNDTGPYQTPDEIVSTVEIEDPSELATDVDRSIESLTQQVEIDDSAAIDPMGMLTPAAALDMLRPMIQRKVTEDRSTALKTLAVLHLETGALLDKHADADPIELID